MDISHRSHSDSSNLLRSVGVEIDPNSRVTFKTPNFSDHSWVSHSANDCGEGIFQCAHMRFGRTWIIAKIDNRVTHDLSGSMPSDISTSVGFDNGNVSGIENVVHVTAPADGDD